MYIAFLMKKTLGELSLLKDPRHDNRLQLERIVFLAAEALRAGASSLDLGLQTQFQPNECRFETITSVLFQCEENGWLRSPLPSSDESNFTVTSDGMRWISILLEGEVRFGSDERYSLTAQDREEIERVVRRWVGRPPWEFQPEILDVAGRAYIAPRVVPHYDLSDRALRPFLEGYSSRASLNYHTRIPGFSAAEGDI